MNTLQINKFHKWNPEIAIDIAKKEFINMTADHWEIIYFLRNFYLQFNITPSIRILIQILNKKAKNNKYSTRYFFKLFPKRSIQQAYKIAGIPKLNDCF